ncbi:hypothetical protein EJB05_13584, partial [Eragrostis curvula]
MWSAERGMQEQMRLGIGTQRIARRTGRRAVVVAGQRDVLSHGDRRHNLEMNLCLEKELMLSKLLLSCFAMDIFPLVINPLVTTRICRMKIAIEPTGMSSYGSLRYGKSKMSILGHCHNRESLKFNK